MPSIEFPSPFGDLCAEVEFYRIHDPSYRVESVSLCNEITGDWDVLEGEMLTKAKSWLHHERHSQLQDDANEWAATEFGLSNRNRNVISPAGRWS